MLQRMSPFLADFVAEVAESALSSDLHELQDSDPGRNIQRYGRLRATSTRRSRPRQLFLESGFDHLAVYLRNVITGCAFAVRVIP